MNTGDKKMLLVPTMRLRWKAVPHTTTMPKVLQQYFHDRSVCKEDGTPATGYWIDVPTEVTDE